MNTILKNLIKNFFRSVVSILNEIPDEIYEELFGDHVKVKIKRDETIKISEYEHD